MVKIPDHQDPTLEAVDRALEATQQRRDSNGIGMGSIGNECDRMLWYGFRWVSEIEHDAATLKRFADGHAAEEVMTKRLRLVDGITLVTVDPESGRQYRHQDFGGHFSGYMDGAIVGLIQAPKTWHVWEHKSTAEKKLAKLVRLIHEIGEKQALAAWNPVYYAQAVLYMHYAGLERHYMTVSTPGNRTEVGLRTESNIEAALRLIARAKRLIFADRPPERISEDPSFYLCRWCDHARRCHDGEMLRATCRSCLHVTPEEDGSWHCDRWGKVLSYPEQQAGCPAHLFIPDLIRGEQIDAGEEWVSYRMPDGSTWIDGAKKEDAKC